MAENDLRLERIEKRITDIETANNLALEAIAVEQILFRAVASVVLRTLAGHEGEDQRRMMEAIYAAIDRYEPPEEGHEAVFLIDKEKAKAALDALVRLAVPPQESSD